MSTRFVNQGSGTSDLKNFPTGAGIKVDTADDLLKYIDNDDNVRSVVHRAMSDPFSGVDGAVRFIEVTISTAELLALNAAPKTIVAAAGAGKVNVPIALAIVMDYAGVAYNGIAAGEDLALRYTDGSGVIAFTVEATGFLDQASDQIRMGGIDAAAAAAIVPVANAPLVLHMTTGEIATGTSPLRVKLWYSVFSTGL